MNLPFTYAASVMSSVLFPAFAEVQGEPVRLRRGYLLMTQIVAMIAAPMMATLVVVAPHLVRSLYGPKWAGAVMPLQILCMAGYFRALYHLGGIVAQSVGQVYGELRNQLIYAGAVIVGAVVGSRYGISGVAAGVTLSILIMFIETGRLATRATGASWRAYLAVQWGGIVAGAVTWAVAESVRLLLEAQRAPSFAITCGVLAASAVPWSIAVIWQLGRPECKPLHAHLPGWGAQVVEAFAKRVARTNPATAFSAEVGL